MTNEVEHLRNALAQISLAASDTTTAAADKVRDMARIARTALKYPYNAARIAWELERTAMGDGFHGNALRVAKDIPSLTDEDRALLDRYATGRNSGTDHVALQNLALRIDRTNGVQGCPNAAHMGERACKDRSQCWEPCGELGHSEEHVRVGRDDPAKAASGVTEVQRG